MTTIRRRQPRRLKQDSVPWVGLAFNQEREECGIVSLGRRKADALAKASVRVGGCVYGAFPCCDAMAHLIQLWLQSFGVSEDDAVEAVRGIGREVVRVLT